MREERQIRVRFLTKDKSIRVTETPFAVPLRLCRPGLSKIINHLLDNTTKTPFDFLLNDVFLRCSLEKHIIDNAISEESLLTIEYCKAVPEPEQKIVNDHPDWISCMKQQQETLVTGCYDGKARIVDSRTGTTVSTTLAHDGPIKALDADLDLQMVLTGGKDCSLKLWNRSNDGNLSFLQKFSGHTNSIQSVSIKGPFLASGCWDGVVRAWKFGSKQLEPLVKRQRLTKQAANDDSDTQVAVESFQELGHSGCVSGVCLGNGNSGTLYSASWDNSIKCWDLETNQCKHTMSGVRPITSMNLSSGQNRIATTHADHAIRIWDERAAASGGSLVSHSLRSHKAWVSSVCWMPNSDNMLLSGAYDGTLKLWDTRSTVPLATVAAAHVDHKVLDVEWLDEKRFSSGGTDNKLKLYSL